MKIKKQSNKKRTLIIIIAITLLVAVVCLVYVKTQFWPLKQYGQPTSDTSLDLPKIESSDNSQRQSDNTEQKPPSDTPTPSSPTKTEGKTPTQYENEQTDDTPVYGNEQFRIPESNYE